MNATVIGSDTGHTTDDWNLDPLRPYPLQVFSRQFCQCLNQITRSRISAWNPAWNPASWDIFSRDVAVHKTVQVIYFAVHSLREYIRLCPFDAGIVEFSGIWFDVVLEMVGLPSLKIDFAADEWAKSTVIAISGDLQPLAIVYKVLDRLNTVLEGRVPES